MVVAVFVSSEQAPTNKAPLLDVRPNSKRAAKAAVTSAAAALESSAPLSLLVLSAPSPPWTLLLTESILLRRAVYQRHNCATPSHNEISFHGLIHLGCQARTRTVTHIRFYCPSTRYFGPGSLYLLEFSNQLEAILFQSRQNSDVRIYVFKRQSFSSLLLATNQVLN
jgi:hypothetical protein